MEDDQEQAPAPFPPQMASASSNAPAATRKPLKVQPKNAGRRSEAERKRIEKEEAARRKTRLAAATAEAAAEEERRRAAYGYMTDSRGRGGGRGGSMGGEMRGGKGGRGGYMGGDKGRGSGRGRGGGGRFGGDGFSRIKKEGQTDLDGDVKMEGGGGGDFSAVKQEGGYVSSSDDEARLEGRKNIEYINLSSEEEDDDEYDSKDRVMHRSGGLMPVRLKRTAHVDRIVGINTEASSAAAAKIAKQIEARLEDGEASSLQEAMTTTTKQGKARAKDIEYLGAERKWKGVYDENEAANTEVRIKEEPREDDVTMLEVPDISAATTQTPQPEDISDEVKPLIKRSPNKQRPKAGLKGPRGKGNTTFQTEEDRREWEIQQRDLEVLQDELGRVNISSATLPGASEKTSAAPAEADEADQRADNVYIFQLPPILPGLATLPPPRIKPESPTLRKAVPTANGGESSAAGAADGKQEDVDSDMEEEFRRSEARETAIRPHLDAGRAGKLRVYKSGRVTLDWGGASMEVTMGLDAYFLQSAVLTKMAEEKEDGGMRHKDEFGGEAMSFGQVRGKFVVTPDWEEILG